MKLRFRRRGWWKQLNCGDDSIYLSQSILGGLILEASHLTNTEQLTVPSQLALQRLQRIRSTSKISVGTSLEITLGRGEISITTGVLENALIQLLGSHVGSYPHALVKFWRTMVRLRLLRKTNHTEETTSLKPKTKCLLMFPLVSNVMRFAMRTRHH